ncbi:MAG: J domain-containing protein [Tissierellia bacterium]|nr:J domain-containing protein [Tissierellia bacterium]
MRKIVLVSLTDRWDDREIDGAFRQDLEIIMDGSNSIYFVEYGRKDGRTSTLREENLSLEERVMTDIFDACEKLGNPTIDPGETHWEIAYRCPGEKERVWAGKNGKGKEIKAFFQLLRKCIPIPRLFFIDGDEIQDAPLEESSFHGLERSRVYEQLLQEKERLRIEVSMLLMERDELRHVECKELEMIYMLSLGDLEFAIYDAYCQYERLKRKCGLIQMAINRKKQPDLKEIERILKEEFQAYQRKLEDIINKINEAHTWHKSPKMTDAEYKELKSLYRKIMKTLHPDVNPDATEEDFAIMEKAKAAYEEGDLYTMRLLMLIADKKEPVEQLNSMEALTQEIDRLKSYLERLHKEIQYIKSKEPYTYKEWIFDDEKVEEKRESLRAVLEKYEEAIQAYEIKIEDLLK